MHEREKPRALENGQSSIITFWVARLRCESTFRRKMEPWKSLSRTCNIPTTNALTSEEIFSFQNTTLDDDKDLVMTLKEANTKPSQIKRVLAERKNKIISTQRLRNLISKFLKEASHEKSKVIARVLIVDGWRGLDVRYGWFSWVDSLFLSKQRCDAEKNRRL